MSFYAWVSKQYFGALGFREGGTMPFITVKMVEGRTLDQKREIVSGITKVVAQACNISEDRVYLFIEDMTKEEYGRGGVLLCDKEEHR